MCAQQRKWSKMHCCLLEQKNYWNLIVMGITTISHGFCESSLHFTDLWRVRVCYDSISWMTWLVRHDCNRWLSRRGHLCTDMDSENVTGGYHKTIKECHKKEDREWIWKRHRVIKATCWVVIWDMPGCKQWRSWWGWWWSCWLFINWRPRLAALCFHLPLLSRVRCRVWGDGAST